MRDALTFSALWALGFTAAAALPLGLAIAYSVLRSRERPDERQAHELYVRLLEDELYGGERCFSCGADAEPDWLRCPYCTAELRERCDSCFGLLKLHWSVCPRCASPAEASPLSLAA